MTSDLAGLLARVARLDPDLACGIGRDARDPDHWLTPVRLATEPGLLERMADAYGAQWGVAGDRTSQASFIVLDYSWYAFAPLVATYLPEGALPSLDGAEVWLDPSTREGHLALSAPAVARPATIDGLRAQIERHMAPIVEAIGTRRWLGRRTAWWGIGDRVVGAFEHVALLLGDPDRARVESAPLVHRPGSALDSPRHRFLSFEHDGRPHSIGLRASCCRFYRVPDNDHCLTCPLVPEDERLGRIRSWIEKDALAGG